MCVVGVGGVSFALGQERDMEKREDMIVEASGEGKLVCVTGASGFIASWLVKELLQRRYTVRASVRSLQEAKKTEHLLRLEGASERLHLFQADLLSEGSFDSGIDGCDGVFHTASPCFKESQNPRTDLLDPAIRGTLNVLASCSRSPTVKRVVLTSSISALTITDKPRTPLVTVDESWFSDPHCCRTRKSWYGLSKTLAEESAWRFSLESGIDLVTINPGMVIGPLLQPTLNYSSSIVLSLINGSESYENFSHGWVHVKDVVEAHIRAFETASASGRYVMAESVAHFSQIVDILRDLYPTLRLPNKCADDKPLMPTFQVSKEKVKSLGITYVPVRKALFETVESLKEKKFASL